MSVKKCERGGSAYLSITLEVVYFGDQSILLDISRQIYVGKAKTLEVSHKWHIVSKYICWAFMCSDLDTKVIEVHFLNKLSMRGHF